MKFLLCISLLFTCQAIGQNQMALWTFPSVANASTTAMMATIDQMTGTPSIRQYYQSIDQNGKGGTAYLDFEGVNQAATSAIAWDDIKGSGADAELWFTLNTEGWSDINLRFDYKSRSADGFDVDYSLDGGLSWNVLLVQTAITDGYTWQSKNINLASFPELNDNASVLLRFGKFDDTGNDELVFDNIEFVGTRFQEIQGQPYIVADTANTTRFLNLKRHLIGTVSAAINDPTDPARTKGIDFIVRDFNSPVNTLNISVTSTVNSVVDPAGLTIITVNDSVRRLFINPVGIGYTDIQLLVSDGTTSNQYTIKYAASGVAYDPVNTYFHTGVADASTAISVGDNYMVIANDESNSLLLYHQDSSGYMQKQFDMGTPMGLLLEGDFEASFRKGNKAYWMGSLGNSKSGNIRPDRHKFFSTSITGSGATTNVQYEGSYTMRDDVISWGDANGYDFTSSAADGEIPKQIDGFNVEGLVLGPDELSMYIGFRAPLVPLNGPNARTKALICPVENFEAWYNNGSPLGSPTFGNPIELDLGGRSIRSIDRNDDGEYLIIAGDYDEGNFTFALYEWSGNPLDQPLLLTADLTGLNPEGILDMPTPFVDGSVVEFISDDGTHDLYADGTEAKMLPNANWKKFRSQKVQTNGATNPVCIVTASNTPINACSQYQ